MNQPPFLPYGRQWIDDDDVAAVVRTLRSDYLTTGPETAAFEKELAAVCGAQHAVAVANGTAALHCAYAAAGVGPGVEVVTTPLTFSATSNMVVAMGGRPVFADIDPETLCLDPRKAEAALTPATRVLAPVDFAGHPAALDPLMELAARKGLIVVEDAAHAIGARYRGRPIGSVAHLTTFSFHPVKTITTGEGGAVVTNDAALAQRARDFRNHGLIRDDARLLDPGAPTTWYYEIQSLGLNYRIPDILCALGRSQLRKLERFVNRRREIVARYRQGLSGVDGIEIGVEADDVQAAWHLFAIQLRGGRPARDALHLALRQQGIGTQVHYIPVNSFPFYRQLGFDPAATPIASGVSERILSLPLFPAMSDEDVERVVGAVRSVMRAL
ncbi:MAG TPA: UDP-4-amino-4,6-dideoxy-N-acetyl-beta-L-altrosamine transaminase [Polyangia bacterium]|nr:UDP-4-amino-4,6-dideoxy-N-acetyl-beta-L-altrosamine transaminase [Polyangia bacterium]